MRPSLVLAAVALAALARVARAETAAAEPPAAVAPAPSASAPDAAPVTPAAPDAPAPPRGPVPAPSVTAPPGEAPPEPAAPDGPVAAPVDVAPAPPAAPAARAPVAAPAGVVPRGATSAAPAAPVRDASTGPTAADGREPPPLRFRDTWFVWDHSVSSQTIGIGPSYQSADPRYTMTGSIRPRYFLFENDAELMYVTGRIDVVRELTNSDVTTRRGETTFSDTTLLSAYRRPLLVRGRYKTILLASVPSLTFPTSKFSHRNGTFLGVGADVRLSQVLPLGAPRWFIPQITLSGSAGYGHTFTRATVPTNPELRRVRMDPEGRTVAGDQLTFAAFPEHELRFDARLLVDLIPRVTWSTAFYYRPTWKYGFDSVDVCVATGCTPALRPGDPSRFVTVTGFDTSLFYDVVDELSIALGYVSIGLQPAPNGRYRSPFASPAAEVYLAFVGHLDALYLTATGRRGEAGPSMLVRP